MRLAAQRLAGLWPWLFTATLQVALGHAGLEVAATRALIKVTLLNPKAIPFTLEGVFAGSSSGFAEGKLMQVGGEEMKAFKFSFKHLINHVMHHISSVILNVPLTLVLVMYSKNDFTLMLQLSLWEIRAVSHRHQPA